MQNFFPLIYQSQNYDWGKIGTNSLVYQLSQKAGLTNEENPSKPYAELWMGDHPSLTSFIVLPNGDKVRLDEAIVENPERFLGKAYAQFQQKKRLPFLFKVLSVEKVLSLQIHPSKDIAKKLHETKPDVYKDDNHKPEISIALSEFEALCNFRPYEELIETFRENEILAGFIGEEIITKFQTCAPEDRSKCLRQIMEAFFQKEKEQVQEAITKLIAQVSAKESKTPRDKLVLKLQTQFPFDIGVLMSYLLNYLIIQPGQAFVMDPCEPHAYVYGNCLEAMAASDNVIRGCLTPKYIDKETLAGTLSYDMKKTVVLQGDELATHEKDGFEIVEYPTRYEEFTCKRVEIKQANKETCELAYSYPSVGLVLKGKGLLSVKNKEDKDFVTHECKEGESFLFLPDSIIKFTSHDNELSVCITTSQAL